MLRKIMPELPLQDVSAGVAYYRDVLGFGINYQQDDLGVLDRDAVRVLLIARTARHTGIGSAYVYVDDADALHAELRGRGARVGQNPSRFAVRRGTLEGPGGFRRMPEGRGRRGRLRARHDRPFAHIVTGMTR